MGTIRELRIVNRKSEIDVDHPEEITVLSLCSGYGGLELGLARALANPLRVVAVEIDAYALANLEAKAAEGRLAVEALWPDVRTFPAERFRGCFDFVIAGYPCQPFSCSGRRKGDADERHLWPEIARLVDQIEPELVFFENVAGHLSLGLDQVLSDLEEMGFLVACGLFSALEAGVSIEWGKRLFVLGQATSGRGLEVLRLSAGPWRSNETKTDTVRAGEILEQDDGERLPHFRWKQKEAAGRGGPPVAPQGVYQYEWEKKRYVEPGLGRAVDGSACRVDRLRLLGNGVVPAQAELAFRTLFSEIVNSQL